MVQINFSLKEVNCKVVYYGPGLSGKTTNLEVVHQKAPVASVGDLTSIATEGDRTLFFDFLPLNLGQVAGMKTKFQIYTVPGQVYYNSTRKLVLQGSDGVVFVADSKRGKMDENLESLNNLLDNLKEYGMDIATTPVVMQYNKRDLPDIYSVEEMNEAMNKWGFPHFEAVARDGTGVFPTLKHLAGMVLESLNRQHSGGAVARPAPTRVTSAVGGSSGGGSATAVASPPAQASVALATAARPAASLAQTASTAAPAAPGNTLPPGQTISPREATPDSTGTASKRGGKGLLVVLGASIVVGALAAAAYYTGLLKDLLP